MSERVILVTGATGRQGGAALRHLLSRGWRVRALTRNPDGPAARRIAGLGAALVQGDLEDRERLREAAAGAHGVFSVQDFWAKGVGYEGEIRQARNLIAAAADAGVRHFVQTSISRCDEAPGVQHLESKAEIERLLAASGLPATVLRTVFFMDNFADPKFGKLMLPVLTGALDRDTRFHMIAADDIGAFAAEAFDQPGDYIGRTIDIAGDELTISDIRRTYSEVTGNRAPRFGMPRWIFRLLNPEMASQLAWNNHRGWRIAVDEVRARRAELKDFRRWLAERRQTPAA